MVDDLLTGLVVAVRSQTIGTQVSGAASGASIPLAIPFVIPPPTTGGVSVLYVDDASIFVPTGGQITIDGGPPLTYSSADDDASTITLATPLTTLLAEGAEILLEPVQTELTAYVLIGGESDPIPAVVPHNFQDVLRPGVRDEEDRETVRMTRDGDWSWAIYDLVSRPRLVRDGPIRLSDDDGNQAGGVDEFGNIAAQLLSFLSMAGDSAASYFDGVSFADWLSLLPRGVQVYGAPTPAVSGINTTEYGLFEVAWTPPDDFAIRQYRFKFSGGATSSAADTSFAIRVRYTTDGSQPTITSALLPSALARATVRATGTAGGVSARQEKMWTPGSPQTHRFLITIAVTTSGSTALLTTTGVFDFWIDDLGLFQGDAAATNTGGGALDGSGSNTTGPLTRHPQTYQKTFDATDTKWWSGGGTFKGSGDSQYFGNTSGTGEGNRKSVIWFDRSAIQAKLAGATVTKVEVYIYCHNGGDNNTVVFGSHTDAVPSNNYASVAGKNTDRTREANWHEGSARWVELPWDLQGWKNSYGGVIVGPGPSDADYYAGGYRGATHSQGPKLRVTYQK